VTTASVNVPTTWLEQGTLPPICARHGCASTRREPRSFYTRTPAWVILLVFVALLIAVMVALAIRVTVKAQLPGCEQCVADRRRYRRSVIAAWMADAVLLFVFAQLGGAGILLWVLVTAAALVWSFAGNRTVVTGTVSKDRAWVALARVHPAFAGAITTALSGAVQAPALPPVPVVPPSPAPNAPGLAYGQGAGGLTILPGK
jgi:hypothetical protein